jgi:acyl-CoA thioesterase-1
MLALTSSIFSSAHSEAKVSEGAAESTVYLASVCSELARCWPTNRTVNIVCHGHSVPAGYFRTPIVDTFNAYPSLLHHELKTRFPYAVINVIVTAIGGENSEQGAERFSRDVLPLKPDVVTIDYSLNDRGIGLVRAEAAWRQMITNATAQGAKVLLLTPTPDQTAKLDNPADPLLLHAQQVRRLAREFGVGLVDSLAAFQRAIGAGRPLSELMSQSNHPNRIGHELVTAELLRWFPVRAPIASQPPLDQDTRKP